MSERAAAAAGPAHGGHMLHPFTLLIEGGRLVARFAFPLVVLVAAGGALRLFIPILLISFVANAASLLARLFSFRFGLEGGELFTRSGVFSRSERHIACARVQDVKLEQRPLERLFGVVRVEIETAGGTEPELVLAYLVHADAQGFREAVLAARARARGVAGPASDEPVPEELLRAVDEEELIWAGLTSNRASVVVALVFVAMNWLGDFVPDIELRLAALLDRLLRSTGGDLTRVLVLAASGLAVAFVFGLILSVVGTFTAFYGFALTRRGEDLKRRYGLLTRRMSSLPRARIQSLVVEEGALRRPLGLAAIRAVSAGSVSAKSDASSGRDVLLPIVHKRELEHLLPTLLPGVDLPAAEAWRRVSKKAVGRFFLKALLAAGALAASAPLWSPRLEIRQAVWIASGLAAVLGLFVARARYLNLGYAVGERHLYVRRGILGRSTHVIPLAKVQAVSCSQNPFDRRLGLARLSVDTAGQPILDRPELRDLPVEEARRLARGLAARAARTRFRW